jgi:hypothetical protein
MNIRTERLSPSLSPLSLSLSLVLNPLEELEVEFLSSYPPRTLVSRKAAEGAVRYPPGAARLILVVSPIMDLESTEWLRDRVVIVPLPPQVEL